MRGRKPKASHLHLVQGTSARHGGGSVDTGTASVAQFDRIPTCPAHLSATAKAEWKRLVRTLFDAAVLAETDRAILAAYCQCYGRWVEAEKKLTDTPMLIKLPSGYIQPSPWLGIANKQLDMMTRYAAELGLTPVSRGRVSARPTPPTPWEFD